MPTTSTSTTTALLSNFVDIIQPLSMVIIGLLEILAGIPAGNPTHHLHADSHADSDHTFSPGAGSSRPDILQQQKRDQAWQPGFPSSMANSRSKLLPQCIAHHHTESRGGRVPWLI